jgi:hypothetical protein
MFGVDFCRFILPLFSWFAAPHTFHFWRRTPPYRSIEIPPDIYIEILGWIFPPNYTHPYGKVDPFEDEPSTFPSTQSLSPNFDDVRNLSAVSKTFRRIVKELAMASLTLHSNRELIFYSNLAAEVCASCTHLEICIDAAYDPDILALLISRTPRLTIFLLKSFQSSEKLGLLPRSVLSSLLALGPGLKCLSFQSFQESLTFDDLLEVANGLPALQALHLRHIDSYPDIPQFFQEEKRHWTVPIQVLSLGAPSDEERMNPYIWDSLFVLLSGRHFTFPNLRRLDAPTPPSNQMFFRSHGTLIRDFRASLCYPSQAQIDWRSLLNYCPNLETLLLKTCDVTPKFPSCMPSLKRIYITLCIGEADAEGATLNACKTRIDKLFIELRQAHLEKLEEIRIVAVADWSKLMRQEHLLKEWSALWRRYGVKLVDGQGRVVGTSNE